MKRRLAAILAADVVGYSRLMGRDEAGTLARVKAHRKELFEPLVDAHGGTIVKLMGDGALVEFPSVVAAVECAVAIQNGTDRREAEITEDERIRLRIGINLGDVLVEDGDIYGDGVNVAARLEQLAEPGGICVSRTVRNQVRDKLAFGFQNLGEHEVKNIVRPIRVFRVLPDGVAPLSETAARRIPTPWAAVAAAVVLLLAAGAGWWWYQSREPAIDPSEHAEPLPDEPSIAVLPFDNLSDDPGQGYLATGLREDLITDLAKVPGLAVIGRSSALQLGDGGRDLKQVSADLGARFLVGGSIRHGSEGLWVNAEVVDGTTGHHLWAERYEGDADALVDLSGEIAHGIAGALKLDPPPGADRQAADRPPHDLEAYDLLLRARSFQLGRTREANLKTRELLEQAIARDPDFAAAHALLSATHHLDYALVWSDDPAESLRKAIEAARKAVQLDPSSAEAHAWLGWALLWDRQHEASEAALRRAIELDPTAGGTYWRFSVALNLAGKSPEAINAAKRAMELEPFYSVDFPMALGQAFYGDRQNQRALERLREAVAINPNFQPAWRWLASIHGELGNAEEASEAVEQILRLSPKATVAAYRSRMPYKDPADLERFLEGLRRAGLPE